MSVTIKKLTFGAGKPKICVPITGSDFETLLAQAVAANDSKADLVEWRVDYFQAVSDPVKVLETLSHIRTALSNKMLLFTFRTKEEGGEQAIPLQDYQILYEAVAESGLVDLMDVELSQAEFLGRQFVHHLKGQHVGIIMSSHDFHTTPADGILVMKLGMMQQFGADIGKIAAMPHDLKDVLRVMGLSNKLQGLVDLPLILIAMGEIGKVTRISGELIGSVMTYGVLAESSAPGQLPVEALPELLTFMALDGRDDRG